MKPDTIVAITLWGIISVMSLTLLHFSEFYALLILSELIVMGMVMGVTASAVLKSEMM